tara:strand:+ start:2606 stop:2896 length:291 start_codon:yes stop_codon:yes gene_type:complete
MYKHNDITTQLVEHIKKNLSKGYNQDTLRFSLISQGYSKITVENALERANKELANILPEVKEKPKIIYKLIGEDNKPVQIVETRKSFFEKLKDFFS